jgi:hypothetical protein
LEGKDLIQQRMAGRLRECFICGTTREKDLRNKIIVVICSKCQQMKVLQRRLRALQLKEPKYRRMLYQLLKGESLTGEIVETGVRIIHLGKVELLISPKGKGLKVEQLRPDGKGRYIREEIFLSA